MFILQLAKTRNSYFRILDKKHFKEENYINNTELYINFLKNISIEKKLLKPKCLMIGTIPSNANSLEKLKNLYAQTLTKINKRYAYNVDQILFFPHPRTKLTDYQELVKILSQYSTVHKPSSIIVENYLLQYNLEISVGGLSTSLFYAKTIFKKDNVFYLDHKPLTYNKEKDQNFLNAFENVGIKNFLNYD